MNVYELGAKCMEVAAKDPNGSAVVWDAGELSYLRIERVSAQEIDGTKVLVIVVAPENGSAGEDRQ